jgi:hypothetical protein
LKKRTKKLLSACGMREARIAEHQNEQKVFVLLFVHQKKFFLPAAA